MDSEAALARGLFFLAFLARELGAAVGLLPSVSSLPVSAVKRKKGGGAD